MSELVKDSAIKLFGKTISLSPEIKAVSGIRQQQSFSETSISSQDSKEHESNSITPSKEASADRSTASDITDELKAANISISPKTPTEEEQSERTDSPEKTLKKPDKLIPCPRCNSMDTKFCYYNNYNVQQPRYFCKNCQRYWTAGGVMRNVPVGSGRRKSKNVFTPNYHHGVNVTSLPPNGFVVFGSDAFHQESPSNLKHGDGLRNGVPNGLTPSGTNFTFYPPTPYWAGPIHCPWMGPQVHQMPSTLGKHSREGVVLGQSGFGKWNNISEKVNSERPVLIPKTLRIHDPSDAAKSSIWSTLGIKNEQIGSNDGRSLFKAFVAKGDRSSNMDNASLALQANPAAFSRSLRFQESV